MLDNRTRLLLILSQDLLDQARVIAGRATTVLKLPVSLQIVLRALISVGLKRESHSALFANIESQARAVRQKRSRVHRAGEGRPLRSGSQQVAKETTMLKLIGLTVLATAVAVSTLGCVRGLVSPTAPARDQIYLAKPMSVPAGIIASEATVRWRDIGIDSASGPLAARGGAD